MNFKRLLESEITSVRVPKRRLASSSSFLRNATFSVEDLDFMEIFFRRVVREELDRILPIFLGSSSSSRFLNNQIQNNGEAGLRLQFITNPPATVFTGNKIQDDDDHSRILIELTDTRTGSRITSEPLSSLKIDIVVLDGDFDPDDSNFNDKIVTKREGRRPLLNGDLTVTLTQGLGYLENVTFTDNSRWIRCRKFKLGARVSRKSRVEDRIQEASSSAFRVKDHRGKQHKKHHPPYPNDDIWRLNQIRKGGKYCSRLESIGIRTVKDFLRLRETDPSLLKKTLGGKGNEISNTTWESIVRHAAECKIDDLDEDERFLVLQDPSEKLQEISCPSALTFHYEAPGSHFSDNSGTQIYHSDDIFPPTVTGNFTSVDNMWSQRLHGVNNFGPGTIFADQNGPPSIFPSTSSLMPDNFNGLNHDEPEIGDFTLPPRNFTFFMGPGDEAGPSFNLRSHNTARPRVAWSKISAALKWISVRRIVAARRNSPATRQQVFCV